MGSNGYLCLISGKGKNIYVKDLVPAANRQVYIEKGFFEPQSWS